MHPGHDPVAGAVDQHGTLAADRLGDQRPVPEVAGPGPQHGRVELHELDVGQRRRRPAAPSPARRRWRPRDWWWPRTGARRRRSRARPRRLRISPIRPSGAEHREAPRARPAPSSTTSSAWCPASTDGSPRTASSARSISAPVASPPAWMTRFAECPPSRVRSSPSGPASNSAPRSISRCTAAGPSVRISVDRDRIGETRAGDQGVVDVRLRSSRRGRARPGPRRRRPVPTGCWPRRAGPW